VGETLETGISVYPNPFTDELHLTGAEGCTLTVTTESGVTVHTQRVIHADETLHLEKLPAGMYLFHLEKRNKTKTVKAVKN
jgi:hypothetical protein